MRQNQLSLWYLNNYVREEKGRLNLSDFYNFDNFNLKVKIKEDDGNYVHYLEVANFNRTLLCGTLGSGKTYILNKIFKSYLCKASKYCMYFDLRDYEEENLLNFICKRIKCRDLTKKIVKGLLESGEIVFIFDNYDCMDDKGKKALKDKILNNESLKHIQFIMVSENRIKDVEFDTIYTIESLSVREVYKKVIRNYFSDTDDFKEFKNYLKKNNIESFLYRPINLNYVLRIIEKDNDISFIYDLRSEIDLYEKYIECIVKDQTIRKTASYVSYYIVSKSIKGINGVKLRELVAEALREYDRWYDIDKAFLRIRKLLFKKSKCGKDIYRVKDNNIIMTFAYKFISDNKFVSKNIINNNKFCNYFMWKCRIDSKFTFDNILELTDDFLFDMLAGIDDKKVDIFYPYIKLFFSGSGSLELLRKLNIIFQRFRWDDKVQNMTLDYLEELSLNTININETMEDKIVFYISQAEKVFKNNVSKRWIDESRNSELIEKVYLEIIKADYIEEYKFYKKISKVAATIEK